MYLVGCILISYLIAKMKGTKHIKFKKYWNNKRTNTYENLETETANRIAGGLFFAMIILLIFIL